MKETAIVKADVEQTSERLCVYILTRFMTVVVNNTVKDRYLFFNLL